MSAEEDIKRLDGRIDNAQNRCDTTHGDLNKILMEIKTGQARIEERIINAFGELKEGDNAFTVLNERVAKVEAQLNKWKGALLIIVPAATVFFNVALSGIKAGIAYLTQKGGG